jgi:pyrimidine-nucleoside phosphorylase
MRAVDLIIKQRDGLGLTRDEIAWLIGAYTAGDVPDYQMAAWAMAVVCHGMDDRETADLTLAMAQSGAMLDLHDIAPLTIDKHSTGGVGDKTSLVLGPLCASLGLPMAKMSGRGLGFTGGTLDKLESIPSMRVDLAPAEFRAAVANIGLVIAGQTADLAPADRQLYALRDVTGTVDSLPLIAASIMSKKLAAGADCIVLDVKVGRGAFMKSLDDGRRLARTMVRIGAAAGRRCAAILSSMEQPLGRAIGNALEIREVIATLHGAGPSDLTEVCLALGAELVLLAGKADSLEQGRALLQASLESGAAWRKFRQFVTNQGGSAAALDDPERLPRAPYAEPIRAPAAGFVAAIDALELGLITGELGGGRQRKGDAIDPAVGIVLRKKVGDAVVAGEEWAVAHARDRESVDRVRERFHGAWTIQHSAVAAPPLIYETIREEPSNS